jgi:hypothetical protein
MRQVRRFLFFSLLLICILFPVSFSDNGITKGYATPMILVGSTPGDEIIKSLLTIPDSTPVDFIRWNLKLDTLTDQNTFELTIAFGVSQPNTSGFKKEEHLSFKGTYSVSKTGDIKPNGETIHLDCSKLPVGISLIKLNKNLFHLLTPANQLMIGNGGWSYTLSNKQPVHSSEVPAFTKSLALITDTSRQVIFEGRTPCLDFAKENNLAVPPDCFKLKWKLTLYRDPQTHRPATYLLQGTINRQNDFTGNWQIIRGIPSNSQAVIYKLDPEKPEKSISFLAGDENVLFFLDKANRLYVGNSDFSFTLNKITAGPR